MLQPLKKILQSLLLETKQLHVLSSFPPPCHVKGRSDADRSPTSVDDQVECVITKCGETHDVFVCSLHTASFQCARPSTKNCLVTLVTVQRHQRQAGFWCPGFKVDVRTPQEPNLERNGKHSETFRNYFWAKPCIQTFTALLFATWACYPGLKVGPNLTASKVLNNSCQ